MFRHRGSVQSGCAECGTEALPSESPEHVCCQAPVAMASAASAESSSGVKKRHALSLGTKECVIRDIESGLKKASVAAKYGVSNTTVSTIYKNKDKLRQQLQQDSSSLSWKRIQTLEDDEQSDTSLADETLNTDDVWSGLVDSNFEVSTDDAIVAAVRGSAEVATDDESDGEDEVDPTPEPDFPCKDALEYLAKVKTYCVKNSLSEKSLQCLSFVEDEIVRSAVHKHRQTKITAFFR
ncbi:hypothetical protein HPB52_013347 [Rhipicephalus sanguineus]|uniref:HTH psq-type domain-containing protein n=1 Tax=Rhipicephalus sanguineus TaxID=34632 RepID=A0A9D4PG05_RHISA|nr:hypothetical protein HPB52_013347 [Rhipicephalus sanguineus]